MKTKSVYNILEDFAKKLGDEDLTVSFALCRGEWYVSVSCHSSMYMKFDHDGEQRSAIIHHSESETNIKKILGELVDKYLEHMKDTRKSNDIERIEVSEETS